jgi:hypothetical protein
MVHGGIDVLDGKTIPPQMLGTIPNLILIQDPLIYPQLKEMKIFVPPQ